MQRTSLLLFQLGATAVNLVAGEKPADVYSGIAARYDLQFCVCVCTLFSVNP